jgi:hypothetical protein
MELCPMLELTSPFILWPIGIALGGLLFFEIAKRSWRVDPAPRGVDVRSNAFGREPLAPNAQLHSARAPRPSRPAEVQRILAGSQPGWSIPSGNGYPTRCEAKVMITVRVIGEDDGFSFASRQAEFELDAMTLLTPLRPAGGHDKQFVTMSNPQDMVAPGVARI